MIGKVRIAGTYNESLLDGVGIRYSIFFQGCDFNCPGCHNPQTHDKNGGYEVSLDELYNEIKSSVLIDGVTFSGGDPIVQAEKILPLAEQLEKDKINIWCYTGYKFEKIKDQYEFFLKHIDVLVDGQFMKKYKSLALDFRGSSNQRIINVKESYLQNKIVLMEGFR